jgi:hypothetical protein
VTGNYNGSTDTWGINGFRASFGPGDSAAPTTNGCHSASTDTYGVNGFLESFGQPRSQTAGDMAQACAATLALMPLRS